MLEPLENESRKDYLTRVAIEYINDNPCYSVDYDDTTLDGYCLAQDLQDELDNQDESGNNDE